MLINFVFFIKQKLKMGYVFSSGRNFFGKICIYHQGGGNKRCKIRVDFFRRLNCFGVVFKIFKDSFFTSFLALVLYENGLSSYILLSNNVLQGNLIFSGTSFVMKNSYRNSHKKDNINKTNIIAGYAIPLSYLNLFSILSNIELYPYYGSSIARSAGTSVILTTKMKNNKVLLKLKSGWNLLISDNCLCCVGSVSNHLFRFYNFKKAGIIRSLGIRPTVRGVAMNPCDHPHGGGEGKKSPTSSAKSPWGWLTKGTPSKIKKYHLLYKKKFKVLRK